MKEIVINDKQLTDADIEQEVIRVKALIVNSSGKILLAHNNNTYQFPGGHKEYSEEMQEALIREVKEETGIYITGNVEPFMNITTYDDDYFATGKRVKNSIYYYRILTDEVPNLQETHYDELELETEFKLFYLPISELQSFLEKKIEEKEMDEAIGVEMLFVVEEYKNIYGGIE